MKLKRDCDGDCGEGDGKRNLGIKGDDLIKTLCSCSTFLKKVEYPRWGTK